MTVAVVVVGIRIGAVATEGTGVVSTVARVGIRIVRSVRVAVQVSVSLSIGISITLHDMDSSTRVGIVPGIMGTHTVGIGRDPSVAKAIGGMVVSIGSG